MRQQDWVSYGGGAEIVLAVVPVAAAAAVACAAIRLPRAVQPPIPGRPGRITPLTTWELAIASLLVRVSACLVQVLRAALARAPRPDSTTPVTLNAVSKTLALVTALTLSWPQPDPYRAPHRARAPVISARNGAIS